jgi:phosphohistidine phosphatase
MLLYLVRHGIAEDAEGAKTSDEKRQLTKEGRTKAAKAATGLKKLDCCPECIISSPLSRAYQTAEIFGGILKFKSAINLKAFLKPGAFPEGTVNYLKQSHCESVMCIGHMPDLALLASYLISGTDTTEIGFKKAGVCCISFENGIGPGKGCLEWLLQPKQLRKIG